MRRPRSGWPKYKSSSDVDWGKVASVFIIWGLISILTSWFYNGTTSKHSEQFNPSQITKPRLQTNPLQALTKPSGKIMGPITIDSPYTVALIKIKTNIPVQSWAFVEGEVLNEDKEYLFSFGKELWHETGRDSDGAWKEENDTYKMKVTFPQKGKYYINFKTESSRSSYTIDVTIYKKRGSSLPHLWFGIFALIMGIYFNEKKNGTISTVFEAMSDD